MTTSDADVWSRFKATWGTWIVRSLLDYPRAVSAQMAASPFKYSSRMLIGSLIAWSFCVGGVVVALFMPNGSLLWRSLTLLPFALLLSIAATAEVRGNGLLAYGGWSPLRAAEAALGDRAERSPRTATVFAYAVGIVALVIGGGTLVWAIADAVW